MVHLDGKRWLLISCTLFAVLTILAAGPLTTHGQAASNRGVELDVIARLNAWRIDSNVAPLKENSELQKLALQQAVYLVGLSSLPHGGDLHLDAKGQLPPQRAAADKWPNYGMEARTAVGENAAVGDAKFALKYWLHSEIHNRTALNPAYHEVGVAAIPFHNKDYLIIAVFGARPNVLPVFLFPEQGTIYFTNEQYKWKNGGKWIQNVKQIEIYDSNGKPLIAGPIPFTAKMQIPPIDTENFDVIYRDGKATTKYTVNIKNDVALLPHHLKAAEVTLQPAPNAANPSTASGGAAQSAPTKAFVLPPTNTPRPRAGLPPTNTPRAPMNVTKAATLSPIPPTATAAKTEDPKAILNIDDLEEPEIMILYDDDSLVIVNDTDKPADISQLKLRYQDRILEATRWMKVVPVALNTFPADHCLMLELNTADVFLPEACTLLRSVITVNADRRFWLQGDFEVLRGDKVVAVCKMAQPGDEDHCEIVWN